MQRLIMLSAVTRMPRHEATSLVFDTLNRLGGWVDDVRMYSNIMNTIRFTLPGEALPALVAALGDSHIAIDQDGMPTACPPGKDISGSLQITFIHDEPDLRRAIPAVPG